MSPCETGDVLLLLFRPSVVPNPQPVEIIFMDAAGRLRLQPGVRSSDGRISVESETVADVFTQGIFIQDPRDRFAVLEELEELINSDATREAGLQSFFEAHPEFLLGTEYQHLYPHVVLTHAGRDDLIPDFILRPIEGMSHETAIVDLKLPALPVIKATPRREERERERRHQSAADIPPLLRRVSEPRVCASATRVHCLRPTAGLGRWAES